MTTLKCFSLYGLPQLLHFATYAQMAAGTSSAGFTHLVFEFFWFGTMVVLCWNTSKSGCCKTFDLWWVDPTLSSTWLTGRWMDTKRYMDGCTWEGLPGLKTFFPFCFFSCFGLLLIRKSIGQRMLHPLQPLFQMQGMFSSSNYWRAVLRFLPHLTFKIQPFIYFYGV